MRRLTHLFRDAEGLKGALSGGLRFYWTKCNTTANVEDLVDNSADCSCAACRHMNVVAPKAPTPEVDLSDFDAFDVAMGRDDGLPMARRSGEPPAPPPVSFSDLCRRLALSPEADPEGSLGDPDVRHALTDEERGAAATILPMVAGFPVGAPLVQAVYRLCHRITWYESDDDSEEE